jgi:plastocyanin
MRTLFALVAICLLSSCKLSLDASLAPLDCSDSYNQHDSTCSGDHGGGITIVVGPSRQYADGADALCYQLSPVTATVQVGESYSFENNTNSTITIQGANQSTWVTVGPGETSSTLSFSAAGSYNFGVQGCQGMSGTAWYGVLNVTGS